MAEVETKVPVTTKTKPAAPPTMQMQMWRPFESLRREVDRLFEDFTMSSLKLPFRRPSFDLEPFWSPESWVAVPAVDLIERADGFEVHAELPGMDEKDIAVTISGDVLVIKGEKREEKDEKKPDFHVRERRFGSFQRAMRLPQGVDADKIAASFKKGVLTVTLPKTAEAQKPVKTIEVKGE